MTQKTHAIKKMVWKKTLKNVSFMILLLKMCLIFGQQKVVIIDPGHGGKDSGAIGVNGILEKEVVLNIAKEILRLNKTLFDNTIDIYLTRNKDTLISLSDRGRLPKRLKADMLVSLHCNASPASSRGIEVYVHHRDNPNTKASIEAGLSILNESTQRLGFKRRGVKFADFQVLRNTMFCPALLVEMGFVTNTDEANYFLEAKNISAMALTVLLGITKYLNT